MRTSPRLGLPSLSRWSLDRPVMTARAGLAAGVLAVLALAPRMALADPADDAPPTTVVLPDAGSPSEGASAGASASTDDSDAPAIAPRVGPRRTRGGRHRDAGEDATPATDGAAEDAPDPDAPAVDAPDEGVWTWVSRFERTETEEDVEAAREAVDVRLSETAILNDLAAGEVPVDYYENPTAALHTDPLYLDRVDPSEFDIPMTVNPSVAKWVRYFTGSGRRYYARWMGRSTLYRPMMYAKLEAAGLPRDLVYLSMIESGYNAHAYSHAAAAGLWQFIPSTARLYGLRVDSWVDERRDPVRSTDASIKFLGELHQMFGDWYLAWGAYNAGPGRIRRAVRNSGSTDFWTIQAGSHLHPETDNYVPKILAAAIIGKHPERYGFTDITFQEPLPQAEATVDGSVEIAVLARCAGMTVAEFQHLNPALRAYATPSGQTTVLVPPDHHDSFVTALAAVPQSQRVTTQWHTVRRGETLSAIAGRFHSSVGAISRANGLRNADRIYVGMRLRVPGRGAPSAPVATSRPARATSHRVRSGDTLSGIASRYHVSVANLKAWNGLRSDTIRQGQVLAVSRSASTASTAAPASSTRYTVRRGDTLSVIASRNGVSMRALQRDNHITNPSNIRVGQVLVIRGGGGASGAWQTLTVRAGDSLGRIASRNGCSVADLRSWNNLSTTVIQPGQTLRVRR